MPLYEYHCRDCTTQFELLVRGQEIPHCPRCDSDRLEKQLSACATPGKAGTELPMCEPRLPVGCGLPQCGMGGCAMD
jgi:putative FmdB family regulatory protein